MKLVLFLLISTLRLCHNLASQLEYCVYHFYLLSLILILILIMTTKTKLPTISDHLVVLKSQSTGCGIVYLKRGSIVKMAENSTSHHDVVKVYRSKPEYKTKTYYATLCECRIATAEEVEMFNNGNYFTNP